ncbi:MAG: molybdopterin-dependent oxidoreductase [Spirochaetaceae bacterium]|nr:molybdopterin-dependent oxidoreductase [Spirochaetaceae bacterium]
MDFVVCQDIFWNKTTLHADAILPATAWGEHEGSTRVPTGASSGSARCLNRLGISLTTGRSSAACPPRWAIRWSTITPKKSGTRRSISVPSLPGRSTRRSSGRVRCSGRAGTRGPKTRERCSSMRAARLPCRTVSAFSRLRPTSSRPKSRISNSRLRSARYAKSAITRYAR